jgi:hypothetical protein
MTTHWGTVRRPARAGRPTALALLGLALCLVAATLAPPPAAASPPPLETGFSDPYYADADPAVRDRALAETVAAGGDRIRLTADWSRLVTAEPADPSDPTDPAYDFAALDARIADATAHGLDPFLIVVAAPPWAESPGRGAGTNAGSWMPEPARVAAFATALARHYSGAVPGIPRVDEFQLWNEPNLGVYLTPQFAGSDLVGARHYRAMLNAFYDALKAVDPANLVITGGTAPYGDPPPQSNRTAPLAFWREVFCLGPNSKPALASCGDKARFDVLAHHPINTFGGPYEPSQADDDISTAEFDRLVELLRTAERLGTLGTAGPHPVWVTELWWDTDPPDGFEGIGVNRHARWLAQALELLWRDGARVVINLQVKDQPYDAANPFADVTTGVFFADGSPKPGMAAWRFPFVADRRSREKVRVWGRAPVAGRVVIERRAHGGWRRLAAMDVGEHGVFKARLKFTGRHGLRARVGGETSLKWTAKRR